MSYSSQSTHIEDHIHRRFSIVKKVGSGAYGHVWKVEQKTTKKVFALKKIFDAFQHATDAQRTYRQIQILRQIQHPNIIKLHETIKAENNRDVYIIFEFVEADLHNVISENILKDVHIRYIIYQIAKALKYLHSGKVIHRDLKPSNILVNSNCSIKICDFGLVRSLGNGKNQGAVLTEGVATRWYRAPEVLLGSKAYSTPADIWSFGCIIYQILAQKPLFNGSCTLDQVQKVCAFTGYPTQDDIQSLESEVARSLIKEMKISPNTKPAALLKDFDPSFVDLLEKMLIFNPKKRMDIDDILAHEIVKPFRKIQDEHVCKKDICTSIDDNKKFSVEEYRKLVYGIRNIEKAKGLSSSLGAGSVSPKYSNANKTVIFGQSRVDAKTELSKKHSFDQIKSSQVAGYIDQTSKKIGDKQNIRYIRSLNNLCKGQNGFYQTMPYKKETNQEVPNREEVDGQIGNCSKYEQKFGQVVNQSPKYSMMNKYQHPEFSKYIPNNSSAPVSVNSSLNSNLPGSPTSPMSPSSPSWKSKMISTQSTVLSPHEIKEKVLQFRSPKYINSNKNLGLIPKASGPLLETGVKKGF